MSSDRLPVGSAVVPNVLPSQQHSAAQQGVKFKRAFHRKVKTGCRTCKLVPPPSTRLSALDSALPLWRNVSHCHTAKLLWSAISSLLINWL